MVFRRDSKVDAFQRQINALRHQLGGDQDDLAFAGVDRLEAPRSESAFRSHLPDLAFTDSSAHLAASDVDDLVNQDQHESQRPAIPAVDAQTSVVAHTTAWIGNLESSGSLHIHGRVEGSLTAREDVFVAEEGDVDATIEAATVIVAGSVRGTIHCRERFEVLPRGRIAGDVRAPVIAVHEGAAIAGTISMSSSDSRSTAGVSGVRAARGG